MKMSFEEFVSDYTDKDVIFMDDDEIDNLKSIYHSSCSKNDNKEKLKAAKRSRNIAKFFGGKALSGSAAQKKWGEEIREKVLLSNCLSDKQKYDLVKIGGFVDTSKFWIQNKDKSPKFFSPEIILSENEEVCSLYEKHYDVLSRTCEVFKKRLAKSEIYAALSSLTLNVYYEFPDCDFYDDRHNLKKNLNFK